MKNSQVKTYRDIDWNRLWSNARAQKSWSSKGASDWDKKAASFAERTNNSPYIPLLLSRLPLDKSYSVLDVGSGPGTLTLPLAELTQSVTALDYSKNMLAILEKQAKEKQLSNIRTVHCSWEDDWQKKNIKPHDITIASRSMNVADLPMAINKLSSYATKYVFITDRISPTPFDPAAFSAIDREFESGPDYIYTLNFLYTAGIHPCVEILELDQDVQFDSMEEALASYSWMFRDLSPEDLKKLERYLHSRIVSAVPGKLILRREFPPRWALIWWQKKENR